MRESFGGSGPAPKTQRCCARGPEHERARGTSACRPPKRPGYRQLLGLLGSGRSSRLTDGKVAGPPNGAAPRGGAPPLRRRSETPERCRHPPGRSPTGGSRTGAFRPSTSPAAADLRRGRLAALPAGRRPRSRDRCRRWGSFRPCDLSASRLVQPLSAAGSGRSGRLRIFQTCALAKTSRPPSDPAPFVRSSPSRSLRPLGAMRNVVTARRGVNPPSSLFSRHMRTSRRCQKK
jgi:hypothetical protein